MFHQETVCMKYQTHFLGEKKDNPKFKMLFAEILPYLAKNVLVAKLFYIVTHVCVDEEKLYFLNKI